MKTYIYLPFLSVAAILIIAACGPRPQDSSEQALAANTAQRTQPDLQADNEFAVAAAEGGLLEVALGKLAQTQGMTPEIKELGKSMELDHSKANEELTEIAAQKKIILPGTLSDKNQKILNELSKKSGADFDKAYADLMVADHKEDIDLFRKESEKGNDADLKAWSLAKLPILALHLEMAKVAKELLKEKSK
jgi:putative membrane protein